MAALLLRCLRANGRDLRINKTTAVTIDSSRIFVINMRKKRVVEIVVLNARAFNVFVYKNKIKSEIPLMSNERLTLESADIIRVCNGRGRSAFFLVWTLQTTLKKMTSSYEDLIWDANTYVRC